MLSNGLKDILERADVLVVGAGFYGATLAERLASQAGKRVVVIDKRSHVGGNVHSRIDADTGIEVHSYGAHLFHTSNRKVWDYINTFSDFTGYRHRVFARRGEQVFPMPINLATMCQFFGRYLTPGEARDLLFKQSEEMAGRSPRNLEEKAISQIGRPLYEAFIRGYTAKQWQTDPRDLPESIITRLPVRFDFNSFYFSDTFEGLPLDGYTNIFRRMLDHPGISTHLGVDYFDLKPILHAGLMTVYSGPIDKFFDYSEGALGWRTVDFEWQVRELMDYQGAAVMNYSDEEVPWTRIIEFRHFHPERDYQNERTIIAKEFSRFASRTDDPYYPINTAADREIYRRYTQRAASLSNIHFGGRLGTYRYWDMHQAIGAALKAYESDVSKMMGLGV
jgi:UDP-galactopyranose mutase